MDPSWFPQTPDILYNKGIVVWEFWNTFSKLKSETMWLYIKEKKDINVQNNNPLADILLIRFTEFCFFLDETKNCKTAKNRDSQRVEFPKNADIY